MLTGDMHLVESIDRSEPASEPGLGEAEGEAGMPSILRPRALIRYLNSVSSPESLSDADCAFAGAMSQSMGR